MVELEPLGDRMLVRPIKQAEMTAGGVVLPEQARERSQRGRVLAVGPGRRAEMTGELVPLPVEVGDVVHFSKYGGTELTVGDEVLLVLREADVLGRELVKSDPADDEAVQEVPDAVS